MLIIDSYKVFTEFAKRADHGPVSKLKMKDEDRKNILVKEINTETEKQRTITSVERYDELSRVDMSMLLSKNNSFLY